VSIQRRPRDDSGASAVEYSFIVAAIAAVIVMVVFAVGKFTQSSYATTCDNFAAGDFGVSASCS
jgi:Flp pilus assembly pilin Flp